MLTRIYVSRVVLLQCHAITVLWCCRHTSQPRRNAGRSSEASKASHCCATSTGSPGDKPTKPWLSCDRAMLCLLQLVSRTSNVCIQRTITGSRTTLFRNASGFLVMQNIHTTLCRNAKSFLVIRNIQICHHQHCQRNANINVALVKIMSRSQNNIKSKNSKYCCHYIVLTRIGCRWQTHATCYITANMLSAPL